jgi:hypothetical protein
VSLPNCPFTVDLVPAFEEVSAQTSADEEPGTGQCVTRPTADQRGRAGCEVRVE